MHSGSGAEKVGCDTGLSLEVCVDDAAGLQAAQTPEVARIELCAALDVGGLTPSVGLMTLAVGSCVPVYAMIRPRIGNFVFDAQEEKQMIADIGAARELGFAGVVLGASLPDGSLDIAMLSRLSAVAGPMGRTLHRAFDLVPDPLEAVDQACFLGFSRILTSGLAVRAEEGVDMLRRIQSHAKGRIEIMAGSGINPHSVVRVVREGGVRAVHASCRGAPVHEPAAVARLGFGDVRSPADRGVIQTLVSALRALETSSSS